MQCSHARHNDTWGARRGAKPTEGGGMGRECVGDRQENDFYYFLQKQKS